MRAVVEGPRARIRGPRITHRHRTPPPTEVLPFFVMQRPIFVKERCNNAYGVPEYVLSKFVTSLPGLALLAGASGLIIVLPSGLNGLGNGQQISELLCLVVPQPRGKEMDEIQSNALFLRFVSPTCRNLHRRPLPLAALG